MLKNTGPIDKANALEPIRPKLNSGMKRNVVSGGVIHEMKEGRINAHRYDLFLSSCTMYMFCYLIYHFGLAGIIA